MANKFMPDDIVTLDTGEQYRVIYQSHNELYAKPFGGKSRKAKKIPIHRVASIKLIGVASLTTGASK